ncbi:MAG: translation initiation factor IF-3 [Flavobacteriales bacterium]|nr:translation initiation factor IF-3 [Flavobacteriales bacterium]
MNENIRVPEVRLVIDGKGAEVVSTAKALKMAEEMGQDLVEISPNAVPPVAKILDYKKFIYEQKKKKKEIQSKAIKVVVKEIRFGPNTDEHDFQFKLNHAKNFLQEGSKLKAFVFFKGRSILFKEQGEILLLRLAQELAELGDVESLPKLEGKKMIIMISPKKKK